MGRSNIAFNRENALRVERSLVSAYKSGVGPLADPNFVVAPEILAVQGMEPLHQAWLLFYAVGSDHNVESEKHYPLFRTAYNKNPDNINPAVIAEMTESEVFLHFRRNFNMALTQTVDNLHKASGMLVKKYDNDPRNIVGGISSVNDAAEFIGDRNSPGKVPAYGKQLAKLLLKNFCETGLVYFADHDRLPPKIDRHNMRISIATGVVELPRPGWYQSNVLVDVLHDGWGELAMAGEIDGKLLNNLIWKIGSALCRQEDRTVCAYTCPMYERECKTLPTAFLPGGRIYTGIDVRKPFDPSKNQHLLSIDEIVATVNATKFIVPPQREREAVEAPSHKQVQLLHLPERKETNRQRTRKKAVEYFSRIKP